MIGKLIIICILLHIHHTIAQLESNPQNTCNSCCQGQTGREGNPGIPGVPGHHGNVGPKGDKGDSVKGDRGEVGSRGDSGSQGLQGEKGLGGLRGLPGKIGPVGITGPAGPNGLPGVKGQKGEIGQRHANPISAFSAVRNSSFTPSSANTPLPFEISHTNVGDDFDVASGRFTCEIPGIYMFTYSVMAQSNNPFVRLMKDNTLINSVYISNLNGYDMISNSAVLLLDSADQVWLDCYYSGRKIYSSGDLHTSFSGVLLHET